MTTRSAYLAKFIAACPAEFGSANHVDDFTLAGQCFGSAATVVNSRALQAIDSGRRKSPPLHARRDHQRVAGNFVSIRQFNYAIRTFRANAHRFLRRQDFHAEPLRLDHRAAREIAAAQSHRESQIIFDARTHSGLAAGSFALNHYGVQALGGTIHGCRESRRAAADNRQIVEIRLGPRLQTNALRDVRRNALEQFGPIRKKHDRQARSLRTKYLEQTFRFWIVGRGFDIDPLIGNAIARQKIAKFVGLRRPARSQHADALEFRPIRCSPVVEQIVQLGIEMLARRIPRLQERNN